MASTPIMGCIYIFAGNFAPRGYMLCQGQTLPISQYAALFSILGTTYGGNGTSTFMLPDLRGRVALSEGTGPGLSPVALGQNGGVESVTVQVANLPAHNHMVNVSNGAGAQANAPGNYLAATSDPNSGNTYNTYQSTPTAGQTLGANSVTMTGGSQPLNVRNPYLGITYIIATTGLFPTRN